MKSIQRALVWAVAALTGVGSTASAIAQAPEKPVVVISIAPLAEQTADIEYTANVLNNDNVRSAVFLIGVFANGIDKKRPAGAYLVPREGTVKVVAFIPVTDLKALLSAYEERLGKPKDVGGGVLQIEANGNVMFIKETAGWAFVSNQAADLAAVPADPLALLGELPKQYNLAVKVNVNAIPADLRQYAIDEIQRGMQATLEENSDSDEDRELTVRMAELSAKQITQMIQEIDAFQIGWSIDAATRMTFLDVSLTAVPGTALSRQMALLTDSTSGFAGFLQPGAAVTFDGVQRMAQEDIESNLTLLDIFQTRVNREIDNDEGLSAQVRAGSKDVVKQLFAAVTETLKAGKLDFGGSLHLEAKTFSFAAGTAVADGAKFEKAFADLVELAKNEPEFPKVKLNVGTHGDVHLHSVSVAIPESENEAREILGPNLEITIGTGAKALYVAFGKNGLDLMKKSIDASSASAAKTVPPSQVNLYLKPIFRFAASMNAGDEQLAKIAAAVEQSPSGSDEVNVVSTPIPNGARTRIQISEGVVKLINDAAKEARPSR